MNPSKEYHFFERGSPVKKSVRLVQVTTTCWAIDLKSNVSHNESSNYCLKIFLDQKQAISWFDRLVKMLEE